ncbi:MAG TPA: hypothetical protein PKA05_16870 [Roseiflexaceae bacterium]|nr:hypothetical protein [Roseiflexaceae bacterium]HMP42054.1 hypothetical protein [Roseiflexaceae bacterium]
MQKPLDPIETLTRMQDIVDRILGAEPLLSDRQIMIAVLRTLADREERRAGLAPEPPPTPPTASAA